MDLFQGGSCFEFFKAVAKNFLVRRAVVEAIALNIDHGDHVAGIFGDEAEKSLLLDDLASNAHNLKLLVDGVDIKQQDETDQASDGWVHGHQVKIIEVLVGDRSQERSEGQRQQQGHRHRESP